MKDLRFLFVYWLISQEFFIYKKIFAIGRCIVLESIFEMVYKVKFLFAQIRKYYFYLVNK